MRLPSFFMPNFSWLWFPALLLVAAQGVSQTSKSNAVPIERALELARSGRCSEAIPLLKKEIAQSSDKDFRRNAGLAGLRCAMVKNQFDTATEFLRQLTRDFPNDPEVLYVAVHTYSDLATRASQQLETMAPNSAQAHELNAESLEIQGKWDQAEKEYRQIMQKDPHQPGIHFKLGRLLLSAPNPPPDAAEQAKQEFQEELQIDPSNAGAEYILGELARQAQDSGAAIQHFSRATKLDPNLSEAFLGLGMALISAKRFPDAVPALEAAVKLEPRNPGAHYNLGLAYTRVGRKEEAERQFAIHREMVAQSDERENAKPGMPTPQ